MIPLKNGYPSPISTSLELLPPDISSVCRLFRRKRLKTEEVDGCCWGTGKSSVNSCEFEFPAVPLPLLLIMVDPSSEDCCNDETKSRFRGDGLDDVGISKADVVSVSGVLCVEEEITVENLKVVVEIVVVVVERSLILG